ncbi:MAG: sulfite exporter TauE/SafE family protein, partial [Flavobacteriales bacterium]
FSFAPDEMKPTALLLNLFVAAIAFFHFWRAGHFNWKLFLVFAIGSIPLSFYGGTLEVDTKIYKVILGVLLLFAIARMLNILGKESMVIRKIKWKEGFFVGAGIGFFSGLIGIGGGIILSPVILLMGWGKMKEAAAVSALFIWVNSASGLGGQLISGTVISLNSWLYVGVVIVGAYFGGFVGSKRINNERLRYVLAFVLLLAS